MDRMYNGRAATMNTIASGSFMRWIALAFQQPLLPPRFYVGCGYPRCAFAGAMSVMVTLSNRSKGVLVFGALVVLATVQISTSGNYSSLVGGFTKSAAETTKKVKKNEPKPSSVTMSNMTVEDMYQRLVYVSALSDNHFKEAKDMFKMVIGCLPKSKLILYNLGLNEEHIKELSAYENVEIRPFPFKNYSSLPHVKNLHTYAWKPIIVKIVSMEYDIIMYGDSSLM